MSESLEQMVEKMRPQLEAQIAKDMADKVAQSLSWTLSSKVNEIAGGYLAENVMPDVLKTLEERHDEIVLAIVTQVQIAASGLGRELAAQIAKNLADSWRMRAVTKALFD